MTFCVELKEESKDALKYFVEQIKPHKMLKPVNFTKYLKTTFSCKKRFKIKDDINS